MAAKRLSDYLRDELVDHITNVGAWTAPVTLYVSLHTADPAGTGANEVAGGSYARQAVTFGAASGGVADSAAQITFQDMPAVTVTDVGLWDASTAGNFLMQGPQTAKAVPAGDDFVIDAGDLDIDLD